MALFTKAGTSNSRPRKWHLREGTLRKRMRTGLCVVDHSPQDRHPLKAVDFSKFLEAKLKGFRLTKYIYCRRVLKSFKRN